MPKRMRKRSTPAPEGHLPFQGGGLFMSHTICVFSDESGVFDKNRNRFFVFGGLILDVEKEEISKVASLYKSMENHMRCKSEYAGLDELKANSLGFQDRRRIFATLVPFNKFGVVIQLDALLERIFTSKKSKQRFQDYAYKIGLKNAFNELIYKGLMHANEAYRFNVIVDQHQTATDGRYELEEGLLQEFKEGTYNMTYDKFFEPIFSNTQSLRVILADSKDNILVRAADIIANRVYFEANSGSLRNLRGKNITITKLP